MVDTIAKEEAAARAAAEVCDCTILMPLPAHLHPSTPMSFLHAALQLDDPAPELSGLRFANWWQWAMQGPKEIGDIETDDEKDEEEQYEQWKNREMRRIRWVITHPVRWE